MAGVTIFVSNMGTSIRFYADVLGMKPANRYGNEFAILSRPGWFDHRPGILPPKNQR
jgi:catechol 2,3-dioxygenase-like lactoylglutathione lyase family enzyme